MNVFHQIPNSVAWIIFGGSESLNVVNASPMVERAEREPELAEPLTARRPDSRGRHAQNCAALNRAAIETAVKVVESAVKEELFQMLEVQSADCTLSN